MQNSENINQEILTLERQFWTAMREQDLTKAMQLTEFPCIVAGAHGLQSIDKEQFIKMFQSSQETIRYFDVDEKNAEVMQVNDNTAVVAYKVKSTFGKKGEEKTIEAVDTSTWIKKDNSWVCVMHTETELKQ